MLFEFFFCPINIIKFHELETILRFREGRTSVIRITLKLLICLCVYECVFSILRVDGNDYAITFFILCLPFTSALSVVALFSTLIPANLPKTIFHFATD